MCMCLYLVHIMYISKSEWAKCAGFYGSNLTKSANQPVGGSIYIYAENHFYTMNTESTQIGIIAFSGVVYLFFSMPQ